MFRVLNHCEVSLPQDFWQNLPQNPSTLAVSNVSDKADLNINHYTHCYSLNVQTARVGNEYRTYVRNGKLVASVDDNKPNTLDSLDYIAAHTTDSFEQAMLIHAGAHERLNGLGY